MLVAYQYCNCNLQLCLRVSHWKIAQMAGDRGLGISDQKYYFPIMALWAPFDPTQRYSCMEPSGITFRWTFQLLEVGLAELG